MVRYADSSAIRLLELRDLQMDNHRHAKGFCYITTLGFVGGDLTGEEWLICLLPVSIIYDLTIPVMWVCFLKEPGTIFNI